MRIQKNAKTDCFAFVEDELGTRCASINCNDCNSCSFYKNKDSVPADVKLAVKKMLEVDQEIGGANDVEDTNN